MAADYLSDSAVRALFVRGYDERPQSWERDIVLDASSSRNSEDYILLGEVPRFSEYLGIRQFKELRQYKITLTNVDYDATMMIKKDDLRRDRLNYLKRRIAEFFEAGPAHNRKLLTDLIVDAASTTCFSGQFFFDTDHSLGDSGTLDNDIGVDISALPCAVHGSTTAPSAEEAMFVMLNGIVAMQLLCDDQGEPINESMTSVLVMVPSVLFPYFAAGATNTEFGEGRKSPLLKMGITVTVVGNPRLDKASWTAQTAIFRNDGARPAFIKQEREGIEPQYIGLASEHCKINKETLYIQDRSLAVGYADFRGAVLVTMT